MVVPESRGRRGAALLPAWEPASPAAGALCARPPGGGGHGSARALLGAPPGPQWARSAVLLRPAWVTPPCPSPNPRPPPSSVLSSPRAARRGAAQPRQALPALKSRPTSVLGLAGIKFCTRIGACAWPQSWADSFPPLVTVRGVNRWWPAAGARRRRGFPDLI